ncbi:MAG: sigma-54 dependent transcriptional regulator [Pirellulaceae bacterium]
MARLLIVDDEPSICWGLEKLGRSLGHEVRTASSAEQALELSRQEAADVAVLDVRLPGMSGLEALAPLRRQLEGAPVIVITAYGDLETAVEAVRQGAYEYVVKPFDLDKIENVLRRALEQASRRVEPVEPREVEIDVEAEGLIGSTPAMQEVFRRVALVAPHDACVLLQGESGTGKDLVARAIHRYGPRAEGPLVAVNVASLSSSLAESELFGHVRGAFTGADAERVGLLAQAHGGTLFLDEVADIPLPLQVKLLRALEHGSVTPVGSGLPTKTDFRVISATHQDLREKVRRGEFRHDLYYRLCTFQIDLPPLRDRADDVETLARYFARRFSSGLVTFSPAALEGLRHRSWHGNVRELRNAVEHAVIVARDTAILPEHFPTEAAPLVSREPRNPSQQIAAAVREWAEAQLIGATEGAELHARLLEIVEPPLLEAALAACGDQAAAAARVLGIHRVTLKKKLDEHQARDADGG